MKLLPNFLIVGAQKCGTTTLHDIMCRHPEANMSKIKEINFFTNADKYKQGLKFYSSFWESKTVCKIIGESTPSYMVYPDVAEAIRSDLGEIKIVIILRDPIRRAVSQYWDNRRRLNESETFEQVIDKYLTETYDPNSKGYFSRGVYIKYIEKYWQLFGKDNVHIMLLEQLINQPQIELETLFNFLEISAAPRYLKLPKASNSALIWNNPLYKFLLAHPKYSTLLPKRGKSILFIGRKQPYKYSMPEEHIVMRLKEFYEPWNKRLSEQTGLNLDNWMQS